ncbi:MULTISPECIES: NADH-quinone oxidoreductase subunit C [Anaerolinea]|uniref:NADH-quinone oxidoreductase subunit C n=1 Tax=Anaerolinea TaxID=233189 RepID=UPI0026065CB4|nr:NADH-quinone oxidoreductase subunit C [Anaerolinea thermophila]
MTAEETLQQAQKIIEPFVVEMRSPESSRLDGIVSPQNLIPALQALKDAHWGYLSAITGLDYPPSEGEEGHLEALYHLVMDGAVLTVRVKVPYSRPELESVCQVYPAASLYERELMEMFGFILKGTPSTDRLLLSDDWPQGVYPLRKSFQSGKVQEESL